MAIESAYLEFHQESASRIAVDDAPFHASQRIEIPTSIPLNLGYCCIWAVFCAKNRGFS